MDLYLSQKYLREMKRKQIYPESELELLFLLHKVTCVRVCARACLFTFNASFHP